MQPSRHIGRGASFMVFGFITATFKVGEKSWSAYKSELAEVSRWWRRSISYLFLYLNCEGRGNIIQKLYFCRYYLQQWKCFILDLK